MKTTFVKSKDAARTWYVADVSGKVLGRAASKIAMMLMGKNKATYTPTNDTGDFIVAINTDKMLIWQ